MIRKLYNFTDAFQAVVDQVATLQVLLTLVSGSSLRLDFCCCPFCALAWHSLQIQSVLFQASLICKTYVGHKRCIKSLLRQVLAAIRASLLGYMNGICREEQLAEIVS